MADNAETGKDGQAIHSGGVSGSVAEVLQLQPCTDLSNVLRESHSAKQQAVQVGGWVSIANRVLGGIAAAAVVLLGVDICAVVVSDRSKPVEAPGVASEVAQNDGVPDLSKLLTELTGRDIFNPPIYEKQPQVQAAPQEQRKQVVAIPDWQNDVRKLNLVGVSLVGSGVYEAMVVGEKNKMFFLKVGDKVVLTVGGQEITVADIAANSVTFKVGESSLAVQ